jgi:hypothetical protein
VRGVAVEVDDTHLRPYPCEVLGDGPTDSSTGTGDQHRLASQSQQVSGIGQF